MEEKRGDDFLQRLCLRQKGPLLYIKKDGVARTVCVQWAFEIRDIEIYQGTTQVPYKRSQCGSCVKARMLKFGYCFNHCMEILCAKF